MSIATEAAILIDRIKSVNTIKSTELDEMSKPLLNALMAAGHITQSQCNAGFVEAQSIWEFGHIALCLGGCPEHWIMVERNGNVF